MISRIVLCIFLVYSVFCFSGCGGDVRETNIDGVIYLTVESDPSASEVYWRVASGVPEVRSTNRFYLGLTPYHETRYLNMTGLTKENSANVVIVIEVKKKGYYEVVERLNMASILDERKISLRYQLEKSDGGNREIANEKGTDDKGSVIRRVEEGVKPSQNPYSYVRPVVSESPKPLTSPSAPSPAQISTPNPLVQGSLVASGVKDSFEPNDSPETGTNIYPNREYLASLHDKGDLDHYLVILGETMNYTIALDKLPSGSTYSVSVLTHPKDHKEVYSQNITDSGELKVNLKSKGLKTGIYCIKVSYVSGDIGNYQLQVKFSGQ